MVLLRAEQKDAERRHVLLAQQGDVESFRALIDLYDRRLLYFVRRFCNDAHQALDVLQEVWLTLWRKLPGLRAPEAFRVWLYQIAHDKVVTQLRRTRREEQARQTLRNGAAHEPEGDWEPGIEQVELVHQSLHALTDEHRAVLTLRFLEDMTLEDIALALRINPGTVKSRLHYAKLALRREVEKRVHGTT